MPLSLLGFVFLAYLPEGLGKLEELPPAVNYQMRNGGSGEGPEIAEGRGSKTKLPPSPPAPIAQSLDLPLVKSVCT